MRKFRFTLDRLLRLRAQREKAARRALAEAVTELVGIEDRLRALDGSLESCQPEIAAATTAALARALEAGLKHSRKRLESDHSRAVHRTELRRSDYRESHRDLESLRRLRQRRRSAWLQAVRSAEQSELDEVARIRHDSARRQEEQEAGR